MELILFKCVPLIFEVVINWIELVQLNRKGKYIVK